MKNEYLQRYRSQNLRRCQLKQVEILDAIDAVCRKYDIEYWLDAGTLLGAVRHEGFIPWDDDIDIAMRSEDVDRFVVAAQRDLPKHLFVQTPDNEPTKEPLVKVRDLNSFFVEGSDNFDAAYEKGIFVDIFPFVEFPDVSEQFIRRVTKPIARSRAILHKAHYYSWRSCIELIWFSTKLLCFKAIWKIAGTLRPASKGKRTGYRVINNGCGNSHLRTSVWPLTTIKFEGKHYPAPHDVDAYLSDLFHNYMQIPPPEQRQIHSVFFMPQLVEEEKSE